MTTVRIRHVDAFTSKVLEGNPCAVVDGEGLSGELMQRIALNQKLSETVFLLPPQARENHAHIRIFTPGDELPFAGHPTISAAHTLITEGVVKLAQGESLRIETGAGVIPVEVSYDSAPMYSMTQGSPSFREAEYTRERIAQAIGLAEQDVVAVEYVSTGLEWLIAQVASLESMLRVEPDMVALMNVPFGLSIFCLGAQTTGASVHVRSFAPRTGVFEDPVTGSSNGCIAAFIAHHAVMRGEGGETSYVAEQGLEMGQPGCVFAHVTGIPGKLVVHIGGNAVTALTGELALPD